MLSSYLLRAALCHLSHPSSVSHSIALSLLLYLLSQPCCLSACGWYYYVGIEYAAPNTGWIYSSDSATSPPLSIHILPSLSELSSFLPSFLPLHPSLTFSPGFMPIFSSLHSSLLLYLPHFHLPWLFSTPLSLSLTLNLPLSPLDLLSTCFLFFPPTLLTLSLSSSLFQCSLSLIPKPWALLYCIAPVFSENSVYKILYLKTQQMFIHNIISVQWAQWAQYCFAVMEEINAWRVKTSGNVPHLLTAETNQGLNPLSSCRG